jgi:hypothetical protein
MRAVDCPCGEHLEARTDGALFDAVKEHANEEHEGRYSDADLKVLVNSSAYDAAGS